MEKIAVIGIGCRFPGNVRGPENFWEALTKGTDLTSDLPEGRWDLEKFYDPDKRKPGKHYPCHGGFLDQIDQFDPLFFGISPREAPFLDPQQRLLLETSWEAMEDGGIDPVKLVGSHTGVFMAGFTLDYKLLQLKNEAIEDLDIHSATGFMMTMLSNRISYIYDFRGPSMSVDTACSGSLVTIHLACKSLLNNECSLALAGGVNVMSSPELTIAESKAGFLSPEGRSKAFASTADGYARGEGAGIVVLKRLTEAIKDGDSIYAIVLASGVNQDGHTGGITVPNGQAQEALMKEVYRKAGVSPGQLTYIETHGTGTPVGDPIEANAIAKVVSIDRPKDKKCIIGSVKTNIGHLEAAAGVAAMIKGALVLKHKEIPPHLHFTSPNPKIPFDELCIRVPTTLEPLPNPALVGINSFGFGGTNAHILLEAADKFQKEEIAEIDVTQAWPFLIPISARSEKALKQYTQKYVDFLKENKENVSLFELGSMMSRKRSHHEYRLTVPASSIEELTQMLEAYLAGQTSSGMSAGKVETVNNKVVFVYTGMGPIWWAMGRQLLEKNSLFKNTIKKCDNLIHEYAGWSLMDELLADEGNSRLDNPEFAQPANFALQIGLTEVWKSFGIIPDAVVGHSVGEVAAAYVAGIYTLEDAIAVSVQRSRVQQKTVGKGTMLAAGISEKEAVTLLDGHPEGVSIAAVNSPNAVTFSGEPAALKRIGEQLTDEGRFARLLKVNVAYHSHHMDPYQEELMEALKEIKPKPATIPIFSTTTGKIGIGAEFNNDYWWRNVRQTVCFEAAMYEIIKNDYDLFMEVGPHPVLSTSISECLDAKNTAAGKFWSLKRNENEQLSMLKNLGALYAAGYPLDWQKLYPCLGRHISLPMYPWQWETYWREVEELSEYRKGKNKHRLLGRKLKTSIPIWENELNTHFKTYLLDHKIQGSVVFPGAGYVEFGMACARSYYGDGFYTLEDIRFETVLILDKGVSPIVQVALNPKTAQFVISSRIPGTDMLWTRNASGVIRTSQNAQIALEKEKLLQIFSRCNKEYGKDVCYKAFYDLGFHYGPNFQGVTRIWKSDHEALGRIEIPEALELDSTAYDLHPALLDAAFQVAIASVTNLDEEKNSTKQSFLPIGIDSVQFYGRPEQVMMCHIHMPVKEDKSLDADIRLYGENGNCIAEIRGLRTKKLENNERSETVRVEDSLFQPDWELMEGEEGEAEEASASPCGAWLIFADYKAIGKSLAKLLEQRGAECFFVYPGDEYRWRDRKHEIWINPANLGDLTALFDELAKRTQKTIQGIVHMWSLNVLDTGAINGETFENAHRQGWMVLKHLVQAIGSKRLNAKLWIITRGAQMVNRETPEQAFLQSMVWGLGSVIAYHEVPSIWGGLVDLDNAESESEMAMLASDLFGDGTENLFAYRNGNRFALRVIKSKNIAQKIVPVYFHPGGSYIVTGAFGGLGMLTARWMAARGARHLVLIGRSKLPERCEWNNVEPGSVLSRRIEFVRELESMGATVHIAPIDIADENQLFDYFNRYDAEQRPPIRGVIHSAGITNDVFLEVMEDETFYQVLAPKVKGTWNLHRMLEGRPVDCFILFSSIAALVGSAGQGAYAAGNAFMDSMAHHRISKGLPALTINWGPWAEVGMAARLLENSPDFYKERGAAPIPIAQADEFFDRLMTNAAAQNIVMPVTSWRHLRDRFFHMASSPSFLKTILADESEVETDTSLLKSEADIHEKIASSLPEERQNIIEEHMKTLVAGILRLDPEQFSVKQPLIGYGMDSLLAAEIKNRMEAAYRAPVSIVDLLKGSSLSELSEQMLPKLIDSGSSAEHGSRSRADEKFERIPKAAEKECYKLSSAQNMIFVVSNIEKGNTSYNIPTGILFENAIDPHALEQALMTLIDRHEVLRTSFEISFDGPVQRIHPAADFTLEYFESGEESTNGIIDQFIKPFDLRKAPLMRACLIKVDRGKQLFLLDMHHIISDGTSSVLFFEELTSLLRGETLPEIQLHYKDFSEWQNELYTTQDYKKQEAFWLDQFENDMPVLDLPTDYPRPVTQSFEGDHLVLNLDRKLTQKLKTLSVNTGATVYMILLAAFNTLLYRYSGQEDIIVGAPTATRSHFDTQRMLGMFVNTLAFRNFPKGNMRFSEFLKQVRQSSVKAYENQDYRFDHLVKKLRLKRDASRNPLFSVMFSTILTDEKIKEREKSSYSKYAFENKTSKFDLTFQLTPDDQGMAFELEYCTRLFKKKTIKRLAEHYLNIVEEITSNPEKRLSEIQMLSREEKQRLLAVFNDTAKEYPKEKTLHQLFEEQVDKAPNAMAVVYENEHLTYAQLNSQANKLAHHLIELGVKPDSPVAICVERSLEMIVGLLAILKAGGAYVPLDPAYPPERLKFMLEDSAPVVLLTSRVLREGWSAFPEQVAVIEIDDGAQVWKECSPSNLNPDELGLTEKHLAYIIYTSGSTGKPKGVMVEHANVVRLFSATDAWFHFGPDDVWTLFHSYAFDFSVWEIWGALLSGGLLVIVPQLTTRSPGEFYQLLCRQKVTVLNQTPSAFKQLITAQAENEAMSNHCLRLVIFGGEALDVASLKPWYARNDAEHTQLVNMYGITETTVHVTYRPLLPVDTQYRGASPIGSRIPDLFTYILDQHRQPVPIGVTGELYIGGAGVARGYLNRPEITEARFLPDPFAEPTLQGASPRMYRTGDLARFLPDGTIEYLGRIDFQVKVRGFRIELGEIETRLSSIDGVREVVVLAREDSPGDKRLVAYYTGSNELSAEPLRRRLSNELPEYMVPAAFVHLEDLPLTPNGKLDHKVLPPPEGDAYSTRTYEEPQGQIEQTLSAIWSDLLRVERVGRNDHFFELGGYSLLAITLISRMSGQGLHTDMRTLFTTPVLGELAATISNNAQPVPIEIPPNLITTDCEHITPELLPLVDLTQADIDRITYAVPGGASNIQDIYPLSPMQKGMLFHHLLDRQCDAYLLSSVLAFDTKKRLDNFIDAFQMVINRHDILRTAIQWEGLSEPVQVVLRNALLPPVEEVILSGDNAATEFHSHLSPHSHQIDVCKAPLVRAFIAEDKANDRWLLGILNHHLAGDHTTMKLIVKEVQAHLTGEQQHLSEPVPYRNFVAQTCLNVSQDEHKDFFTEMLAAVEEPTAPFELMEVQGDGSGIAEAKMSFGRTHSLRLRECARQMGVSVASLCHLAWAQILSRLTGKEEVVFGTVLFGRMQGGEGVEQAMGMFINTLPVRIIIDEKPVERSVCDTHTLLAELLHHEHAPLSLAQRCSAVLPPAPLFTTLLNYRYKHDGNGLDDGEATLEGIEMLPGQERTNYPLSLDVDDYRESLTFTAQVQEPIEPMRICNYMHTALLHITDALQLAPQTAIRSIEVMSAAEKQQVLFDRNPIEVEIPKDACIHHLFEAQVKKTPDTVAVVSENEQLTYAQLNRQANRLARHLIALGVHPDSTVAIFVERNLEMVLGLLAILKAGGAYVPLDTAYPTERLEFMLKDSAPVALLTQRSLKNSLGWLQDNVAVIELNAEAKAWWKLSTSNLRPSELGLTPKHLAYVIYTSGSTGKPKGVMVEHGSLVNYSLAAANLFELNEKDRVLQQNTLSFDLSVEEIFPALISGAALLPSQNVFGLSGTAGRQVTRPTVVHLTAAHWHSLVAEWDRSPEVARRYLREVRLINVTGDQLSNQKLQLWDAIKPKHTRLINTYGPTETTVSCTAGYIQFNPNSINVPIGRPFSNTRLYILDWNMQPVPLGVIGELYVGGIQVARGYLNRHDLTMKHFLVDPFVDATEQEPRPRMYMTGDLGRWLADGNIEFLGRNDFQVKIRGFRVELGEIESRIAAIDGVKEVAVISREDIPGDKRLVAYHTGEEDLGPETLRSRLSSELPEYMLPAAFIHLKALPLTRTGKLDRKALPAPESDAFCVRAYEEPVGKVEQLLSAIWSDLLTIEKVGRWDHFFMMGGHSLLAIALISRMRKEGLHANIRTLFTTPILCELAAAIGNAEQQALIKVPPNLISTDCEYITPELLPLVDLDQTDIDRIAAVVPGGAANIQDIYPLAPLQEGILFHHLLAQQGDAYLQCVMLTFDTKQRLDRFIDALQMVIHRHDILRTAVHWEGLPEPVQVVWRKAPLSRVEEVMISGEHAEEEFYSRIDPRRHLIDIHQAPLIRVFIAKDKIQNRWLLGLLSHHLLDDHTTTELIIKEVEAHMLVKQEHLPEPVPYRNFVVQARHGVKIEEHEAFFRQMLGTVEEPTAPFGLMNVQLDGCDIAEATLSLEDSFSRLLRESARQNGVSAAVLFHLAWAQVLSRLTGREDVVFGTVVFGRMQGGEGAERAMGMFMNTLPLRIAIGDDSVEQAVHETHTQLAQLLHHEHAPLSLAQRCSAVQPPAPLFTALLNYRYSPEISGFSVGSRWEGMELLRVEDRTNYPFTMSVDDAGERFSLTAQVQEPIVPMRICEYMRTALVQLTDFLMQAPQTPARFVGVMNEAERRQVLLNWNVTEVEIPKDKCIHQLFEAHAEKTPDAVAVVYEDEQMSYAQLNNQANRLARHLIALGVVPDSKVAICMERSPKMMVGLLAILKAGGAYVPLDPAYPDQRLGFMLKDSAPLALLTQRSFKERWSNLAGPVEIIEIDAKTQAWRKRSGKNPRPEKLELTPQHLAYVIYTSGSTGKPKGVMVEHAGLLNYTYWTTQHFPLCQSSIVSSSLAFDATITSLYFPIVRGGKVILLKQGDEIEGLEEVVATHKTDSLIKITPAHLEILGKRLEQRGVKNVNNTLVVAGETLSSSTVKKWQQLHPKSRIVNEYGPTETVVGCTTYEVEKDFSGSHQVPIGRPIANTRIYILDQHRQPVPIGVTGELYIGGAGVARGYLNRPEMTAVHFLPDPFADPTLQGASPRMYRTGDLARFLPDGTIEYLGRSDFQVKVRGFRIELGEIETRLTAIDGVREVAVLAREDSPGDKRLVAYYTGSDELSADPLRNHLSNELPEYMVPAAFVRLEDLPLTPNGKLDRKALPAPGGDAFGYRTYEEPQGEVEQTLAAIWADLLPVERVGRHDHFFKLGGHSLLAIQVISRIHEQLQITVPLNYLFEEPTLAMVAKSIETLQLFINGPESSSTLLQEEIVI